MTVIQPFRAEHQHSFAVVVVMAFYQFVTGSKFDLCHPGMSGRKDRPNRVKKRPADEASAVGVMIELKRDRRRTERGNGPLE